MDNAAVSRKKERQSKRQRHPLATVLGPQTANVLNKLPKSIQAKAKQKLNKIWIAANKKEAESVFIIASSLDFCLPGHFVIR